MMQRNVRRRRLESSGAGEARASQPGLAEAVKSEGAPLMTSLVPGNEIPAPPSSDELVWLDEPLASYTVASLVAEADLLTESTRASDHAE